MIFMNSNPLNSRMFLTRCCPMMVSKRCLSSRLRSFELTRIITVQDVEDYARLSGDTNPVHFNGDSSIVHGTFLLGLVSSVMGTKCPGPGTKVLELTSKFVSPCPIDTPVNVKVELLSDRKIITASYLVSDKVQNTIFVQGNAKLLK